MDLTLSIGQLATEVGCNVRTIRYYEQVGLLPPPLRSCGNQRRYRADDVRRLTVVRHARALGFSLEAIRHLLDMADRPDQSCASVTALARARIEEIDRRMRQLAALRRELEGLVGRCDDGPMSACRIVAALAEAGSAGATA